jgi:hypothetical protein
MMRMPSNSERRLVRRAALASIEVIAVAVMLAFAMQTASAQLFDRFPFGDGGRPPPQRGGGGGFFWPWQKPPQAQKPQQQTVDFNKAPPPRKLEVPPTVNVVVMGDAMSDWLAYGLEDAFAETPEMGVIRKHRTVSGLLRSEGRDAFDWPQAARDILNSEKADLVVMMIGLSDRQSIRERQVRGGAQQRQPAQQANQQANQPSNQPPASTPPRSGEATDEPREADNADATPPVAAPEPVTPGVTTYEFRSEKWAELYGRRIDETIAAMKSKGAPVFWVGLPPVRGARSIADVGYLNELFRAHAEKAGIVYVDLWDGFVDEGGNFTVQGPDFEGQIRRLRSGDGVYFTKAGARKLAHYVEREIRRVMLARTTPMATPTPEDQPQALPEKRPGVATRPAVGPVVPLTASPAASEGLLGDARSRAQSPDPLANRVLVRGEPLAGAAGRADNFAWPRYDGLPTAPLGASSTVTEPDPPPSAPPPAAAAASTKKPAAPALDPGLAPPKPAQPRTGRADAAPPRPSGLIPGFGRLFEGR